MACRSTRLFENLVVQAQTSVRPTKKWKKNKGITGSQSTSVHGTYLAASLWTFAVDRVGLEHYVRLNFESMKGIRIIEG